MQPPRSRTPGIDLSNLDVLRAIFINGTAVIVTLLILRFATLLVSNSQTGSVPGLIQTVTDPLLWPFRFIPPLDAGLFAGITVIDVVIIPLAALVGLLIAGVMTGWRDSTARRRRHPAFDE